MHIHIHIHMHMHMHIHIHIPQIVAAFIHGLIHFLTSAFNQDMDRLFTPINMAGILCFITMVLMMILAFEVRAPHAPHARPRVLLVSCIRLLVCVHANAHFLYLC